MGLQFTRVGPDSNLSSMKFFILTCVLATAAAIEDTADVKEAKAMFYNAFEEAKMGAHAEKMVFDGRVQGESEYLVDDAAVAAAKADFMKYFDARKAGIPAPPGALEPIQYAAPVAAPALYSNAIYNYAAYPYAYNYGAYPYAYNNWGYSGLNPYYYTNTYAAPLSYAAYPTVAIAKEE